jgi:hypothetical protein
MLLEGRWVFLLYFSRSRSMITIAIAGGGDFFICEKT